MSEELSPSTRAGTDQAVGVVEICAALGDDTRWTILQLLGSESLSASALADRVPVTRQAIARHLEVLHAVGLVERRRLGREIRYLAIGSALSQTARRLDAMAATWDERLDGLRRLAEAAQVDRDDEIDERI